MNKRRSIIAIVVITVSVVAVLLVLFRSAADPVSVEYLGTGEQAGSLFGAAKVVVSNKTSRAVIVQVYELLKYEAGEKDRTRGAFLTDQLTAGESRSLLIPIEEDYTDWKIKVVCIQQRSGPLGVVDIVKEKYKVLVKGGKNVKKFNGAVSVTETVFTDREGYVGFEPSGSDD